MHVHVQVRKRPLNKKEAAKNEEDIIETQANSLTVHETKLKVSDSNPLLLPATRFLFSFDM